MGPHREKTPMFFTRLTHSLGRKQRSPSPAIDRSPAPQTSLGTRFSHDLFESNVDPSHSAVFQLPDELILRILSHIVHMPRHTDCYARFRIQDDSEPVGTDRYRQLEADFLRPLSMTCRAMRLRLIPWIWEYLQLPSQYRWGPARGDIVSRGLDTIAGAFYADKFLATSVKYFCALLCPSADANLRPLKVHDTGSRGECVHLSSVRQMPTVPPKPTYAGDSTGGRPQFDST